jgi:hypothetical protein
MRLKLFLILGFLLAAGCSGDAGRPAGPSGSPFDGALGGRTTDCGEADYLLALSPVLAQWEGAIEDSLGSDLLATPPSFSEGDSDTAFVEQLSPVLEQWESALDTIRGNSDLLTTPPAYAGELPALYLGTLSPVLAEWESAIEGVWQSAFLADPPSFPVDDVLPTIICPEDTTVICVIDSAVVEFVIDAFDNCDPDPAVVCTPPSGSYFQIGETMVICEITDFSGNAAACSFTVTLEEPTGPVIENVSATPGELWPPNHKLVDVEVTADVFDLCDPDPTLRIVEVTSNESINGLGDGNTEPDWHITGDRTVRLRSERSGPGSGRTYTIRLLAEDDQGNTAETSVEVRVPHDRGH